MPLHDPTPHRVSGCPVHFLWDGRGFGRVLVRLGFLGFLLTGATFTGAHLLRSEVGRGVGAWLAVGAAVVWLAGQLGSAWAGRALKGRPARAPSAVEGGGA